MVGEMGLMLLTMILVLILVMPLEIYFLSQYPFLELEFQDNCHGWL